MFMENHYKKVVHLLRILVLYVTKKNFSYKAKKILSQILSPIGLEPTTLKNLNFLQTTAPRQLFTKILTHYLFIYIYTLSTQLSPHLIPLAYTPIQVSFQVSFVSQTLPIRIQVLFLPRSPAIAAGEISGDHLAESEGTGASAELQLRV